MPLWRRLAIVGLLGFVVAVAWWGFRPWTSAVSFPAVNNKTSQAVFSCGAPFGAASVIPTNESPRPDLPLPHRPCTSRGARRALAVADLAVGCVGLVALLAYRRPIAVEDEPEHEMH